MASINVRKRLIKHAVIFVAMLIGVCTILYYLISVTTSLEERNSWLKSDIRSLENKLQGLNQKTLEFSDAVKVWESLPKKYKVLKGLRLSEGKQMLEAFEDKYKLTEVNLSFSKPEEITSEDQKSVVRVISSTVNMRFKALSDQSVYQFIDALHQELPGYVSIKLLSMTRTADVTKDVIRRVSQGKIPPLVNVTLDFVWQDLLFVSHDSDDQRNEKRS